MLWFNKSRRAQTETDFETWVEGGVVPTLNAFDNGDVRATTVIIVRMREGKPGGGKGPLMSEDKSLTLATNNDQTMFVFHPHRSDGVRLQEDTVNTLTAFMGTGGLNTPMVASIQNTVIGRADTAGPQGKGYADDGEPMFTIDTTSPHAVASETSVRRLTPVECERLQGFPDNWTEGQSDTNRYKQMGNAVAVPVVEWLVSGIVENY